MARRIVLTPLIGALLMCNGTYAATPSNALQLKVRSSSATEVLTITPANEPSADHLAMRFEHRASAPACDFSVAFQAIRLSQKGDPDLYNEAMPDGSYVRFANYKANADGVKELSVDVSSKRPRFAAITLALPLGYDAKKCDLKGPLEVVFFGK